jgi:hypothetical protein
VKYSDRSPKPLSTDRPLPTKRLAFLAAMVALVAGCASSEPTFLVNGQPVLRITCNLAISGMTSCFRTAGDICGTRGFIIYNWNGDPWIQPYPDPETLQDDPGLGASGLLVACRPLPPPPPNAAA